MSQIIFLTKSLDAKCIREGFADTSSRAFEYGLVSALNGKSDLRIIHLGVKSAELKIINGFHYCSVNYKSAFGFFRLAKAIYQNRVSSSFHIVTTGYYPIEIAVVIILAKVLNCKSFGYVYDTHRQATEKMPLIKKVIANIYFNFGFYWVKKSSALLVLNESFIKKSLINTPYFKTKIGVNYWLSGRESEGAKTARRPNTDKPIIIFAGTMNRENGVNLLIDFVNENKNIQCELHFYGDGEEASSVQALEIIDARVRYFGRVSEGLLEEKLVSADFLINLRDPAGLSVDYSFPSKLIKFMSTGTPVISNRFPGLDDCYAGHLYLIDDFNAKSFSRMVTSLLKNDLNRDVGDTAKDFVAKENDWNSIAEQVIEFLDKA